MKFCQAHWDKLKQAIDDRGLKTFVSQSGEQAVTRAMNELEGAANPKSFDPLMTAHLAIVGRALEIAGLHLMVDNEDGTDRCPLCFLQANHDATCKQEGCTHSFEPWIGLAADDMLTHAKELGLVGTS